MKKGLVLTAWFIIFMAIITMSFNMISIASTTANLIGIIILVSSIAISIKTKCLTNFVNKNEK